MAIHTLSGPDDDLVHPLENAVTTVGSDGELVRLPKREIPTSPRTMARVVSANGAYTPDFDDIDARLDAQPEEAEADANSNGAQVRQTVTDTTAHAHDAFVRSLNGRKGNLPSLRMVIRTVDTPDAIALREKQALKVAKDHTRAGAAAKRRQRQQEGGLGRRLEGAGPIKMTTPEQHVDALTDLYKDWIADAEAAANREQDARYQDMVKDIEDRIAADNAAFWRYHDDEEIAYQWAQDARVAGDDAVVDEQYALQDELESGDAAARTQRSLPKQAHMADYLAADRDTRSSHQHGKQERANARARRLKQAGGMKAEAANLVQMTELSPEQEIDASIQVELERQEQEARDLHGV